MDIQDRIVIQKNTEEEILLNEIKEGDEIFCFKEFEHVIIKNKSSKIIKCEYPNQEDLIQLIPGEEIVLNDYNYNREEEENNIFIPEKYLFQIIDNDNIINFYFKVISNALGENINDIRKIISDFSRGLELELSNSIRGKNYTYSANSISSALFAKIIDNAKMLQTELSYIVDFPIENIEKSLYWSKKPRKISRKKLKYDAKKCIVHTDNRKQSFEKKKLSVNNESNIALRNALYKILRVCKELDYYYQYNTEYLNKNLQSNIESINGIQKKIDRLNNTHDSKYHNSIWSEYNEAYRIINRIKKEKDILQRNNNLILQVRNNITNLINESWLFDIEPNFSIRESLASRRNIHYKRIIDFSNILNSEFGNNYNKYGLYAYKKTYELYEIYVLILIFKILIAKNYSFLINEKYDFNLLFENEEFYFQKDNLIIKIIYNKIVKRTEDEPLDELVNQNSSSNKPDIVLMVYDKNILIHCLIIEVKCRRKSNIYSPSGDTPVVNQLKDYTNFWYFDSNLNLKKDVIDKVYAIYPDKNAYKTSLNANQICLLSIEPVYDYNNSDGFQNLISELNKYL